MNSLDRMQICKYLDEETDFNQQTLKIGRNGEVTACRDPDKRPGCSTARVFVGWVYELLQKIHRESTIRAS